MPRFTYFSKSMSILLAPLVALLSFAPLPLAMAEEEEPNFSYFHDPNEGMPSEDQSKTQAEPPCISCSTYSKKSDSQKDNKEVLKKVQSKPVVAKKEPDECISCGRVKLDAAPKRSVVGANMWSQYPDISGYSEDPQVKAMISYAERHSKSTSGGMCYRSVKEALCRAPWDQRCKSGSLVGKYLYGTPVFPELPSRAKNKIGKNATINLKAEGFINMLEHPEYGAMIKNPASAPKGAILIYQGGKNGGHIEIKTGHGTSGSYISDFRAPDSVMRNELAGRASRNFKLVGVMIKPAEKL